MPYVFHISVAQWNPPRYFLHPNNSSLVLIMINGLTVIVVMNFDVQAVVKLMTDLVRAEYSSKGYGNISLISYKFDTSSFLKYSRFL